MHTKRLLWVWIACLALAVLSACTPVAQVESFILPSQAEDAPQQSELLPVDFQTPGGSPTIVDLQSALVDVYRQSNPSVVYIITPIGSGSGFVFDNEGHIVTNNHVVSNMENFEVVFANGDRRRASLTGTDPDSDLAVLKVEDLPGEITPLPLGEFENILVGQIVVAIGNPFGAQGSMSMGIISGVGRSLPSQRSSGFRSTYTLPEVIQTDAPINPGNSGGPLLNLDGEVIGVNSAIASETGSSSGVGFAIPVSAVSKIVPSLVTNGEYVYSYMGVSFDDEVSLSEQSQYGLSQTQGAYVMSISPGSPADQAGLIPADPNTGQGGDLITAIDGNAVKDFEELNSYLVFHTSPGQTVELSLLRGDKQLSILFTLGSRP